jgi:hypothetical protein
MRAEIRERNGKQELRVVSSTSGNVGPDEGWASLGAWDDLLAEVETLCQTPPTGGKRHA